MRRLGAAAVVTATVAVGVLSTAAGPAAAEVVDPFAKRYDESLYGDFKTIGNTVMGCPTSPADMVQRCAIASQGLGKDNNNTFDMERVNLAGGAAGFGSSTGEVTVPPGAEVAYARLFWGGNDGYYKFGKNTLKRCDVSGADVVRSPGEPKDAVPTISVEGKAASPVSVEDMVTDPDATNGPHYYTGESDVTSAFQGVTTGSPVPVGVGGIWAPNGRGCVAGWSLTVVYKYNAPNDTYAPDRRNVYIYGGHVLQRSQDPDTSITVDGFYRSTGQARASVTAYEGDWNITGDRFLVDDQNVTEGLTGNTNNFFVSAADGSLAPAYRNNLSIDAKDFTIPDGAVPEGATSAKLTFRTKGDTYVPSALAFSVPVPDLEVTKTSSPATIKPGGTLTYTVKAKNVSKLPYPNAKFTDDLTDNLDDATYNNDAKATSGTVSYKQPKISFSGDIPAGETTTVTYSVRIDDPITGDGKLKNNVDVESPRSNCENGSTDPNCGAAPAIEEPEPPVPPITIENEPTDPVVPACGSTKNTITIKNASGTERTGAQISWPVTAGTAPVPSSGKVTKQGRTYVWKGDVPARGTVTITQRIKVSCTPGEVTLMTVTAQGPNTNCSADRRSLRGGDNPCTSAVVAKRVQGRPGPSGPVEPGPSMAETGGNDHQLRVFGGAAAVLTVLGVLAVAISRSRRRH
ncbi:hypothetical protein GCM10009612_05160 [Streptomyces beijiangensis]